MIASKPELPPKIEEILASLAAADRTKNRADLLAREADLETRRAEVAAYFREACARQRVPVSEEVVSQAVRAYFNRRHAFVRPKLGGSIIVAKTWIHRVRLTRYLLIVTATAAVIAVAVKGWILQPLAAEREAEFRKAQAAWSSASAEVDAAESRAELIAKGVASDIAKFDKEPGSVLAAPAEAASSRLHALTDALALTASAANAARYPLEPVTSNPAVATKEEATARANDLWQTEQELELLARKMGALATQYRGLQSESKSLETAWSAFLGVDPPAPLRSRMAARHDVALQAVRQFESADRVAQILDEIERATRRSMSMADLPEQIRTAAERVRIDSLEVEVATQAEIEATRALAAAAAGDVEGAHRGLALLNDLAVRLEQAYTLQIVNLPNEYSRIWTYKNNNHADKSYYVIVEAIDPDGRSLPQSIRSEEDGSVATVTRWAERVDESTYEAVGRDKKDDGIIQMNTFGRKQRGYLEADYLMGPKLHGADKTGGRIYRWPRKNS